MVDLIKIWSFYWVQAVDNSLCYSLDDWSEDPTHFHKWSIVNEVNSRHSIAWAPPLMEKLKFFVDGSAWGSPSLAGYGRVCSDDS